MESLETVHDRPLSIFKDNILLRLSIYFSIPVFNHVLFEICSKQVFDIASVLTSTDKSFFTVHELNGAQIHGLFRIHEDQPQNRMRLIMRLDFNQNLEEFLRGQKIPAPRHNFYAQPNKKNCSVRFRCSHSPKVESFHLTFVTEYELGTKSNQNCI